MASIETGAFQTEPLRQSSRPDAKGPKPGYYSVSPGSPESASADWMCAPAPLSTSRTSAVGAAPDETAAFPGGPGGSAILRRVPIGLLDDGYLAKVDRAGEVGVAWEEMFAALGVSSFEFRLYFKTDGEAGDDMLAAACSALTGDVLTEPQSSLLPKCLLRNMIKLCVRAGLFDRETLPGVSLLAETPARKDDDVNRLRYALSLSRTPCRRRTTWHFDAGRFERDAARLPACYEEDLLSIGRAVESVCLRGERPAVLLKAPTARPSTRSSTASCKRWTAARKAAST